MVFRGPVFKPTSGRVDYGPFPIRQGRLAASFAALLVALLMALFVLEQEHLTCTPGASCVVTGTILSQRRAFPTAALRDARVVIERGSKGGEQGVVVLVVDGAREIRLQSAPPAEAAEVAATIRARVASKQPIDITLQRSQWLWIPALGALVIGITMACSALKGFGRFRLDVVKGGAGLRARRSIFGVPVSSHEVSLEGVTDVRIEGGVLGEMWLGRGETASPAARIVLVDQAGAGRPLTATVFPGQAVHLRAAAELRAILGLERRPGGVEEQLAALPMVTTPLWTRVGLSWIGVTVGSLLGVGLFGALGLALGLLRASELEEWHVAIGGISGAIAGVAVVVYRTRARPPR
jgi:hypothetical protein